MSTQDAPTVTVHGEESGPARPAPVAPAIGDLLIERFRVERRLGQGGSGAVYQVREVATGARLALKALRAPRPQRIPMLKAEFRAVRDLVHPCLVTVHELFVAEGNAFMTMDLIEGESLKSLARRAAGAGEWDRVRALFGQCARGLAALHRHGLLHRDLKPSNVLVEAPDMVRILDFGLSSAAVQPGIGTPGYMAPEQRRGEELSAATDVHALGAMLFEVLSGRSARAVTRDPTMPSSALAETHAPAPLVELCCHMLQRESGARPSIGAVLRALKEEEAASAVVRRAPFVGRERELAILTAALEDSRQGLRSVLIRGPAGAGKSRLLDELVDRCEPATLTLRARCSAYEHLPFNAFDGIVDGLTGTLGSRIDELLPEAERQALGRLFPSLGPRERRAVLSGRLPLEERAAAFRVFARLLSAIGAERPLLLTIDDFQWADADSRALLEALVSASSSIPALLVMNERSEGAGAPPAGDPRVLELGSLDEASLRELAERALGGEGDSAVAARLVRESAGSPLHLEQLAAWVERGTGEPPELRETIAIRLRSLPTAERTALERIAVHGGPLPIGLAGGREGRLSLKNLCVRRLCAESDTVVDTYHGTIRETVRRELSPETRLEHHRWLFDALRESAPHATLADHAAGAGLSGDAFTHYVAAAREAVEALAFNQAAELLETGLALEAPAIDRDRRTDGQEQLAEALFAAGRGAEAAAAYLRLAELVGEAHAPAHRCRAAEQLLVSGHTEEGWQELSALMADLDIAVPRTTAGLVSSLLTSRLRLRFRPEPPERRASPRELHRIDALAAGTTGAIMTDHLRGAWFAARQLIEAERAGDPVRIVRALVYEALYLANEGTKNAASVQANIERAGRQAKRTDAVEAKALHALARGFSALLLGDWRTANEGLREAERQLTHPECRRWWELTLSRKFRSITHWFLGEPATMADSLERWLADADRRGDEAARRSFEAELPLVAMAKDQPAKAWSAIASLEESLAPGAFDESRVVSLHNQMHHALYTGAPAARLLSLEADLRPLFRSLLGRGQLLRITSRFYSAEMKVAASLERGGDRRLLARAASDARKLAREGAPHATLYADLIRSAVLSQQGATQDARELLEATADGLETNGQRLYAAGARRRVEELGGSADTSSAFDQMRALGIVRPAVFANVVAPGFATL